MLARLAEIPRPVPYHGPPGKRDCRGAKRSDRPAEHQPFSRHWCLSGEVDRLQIIQVLSLFYLPTTTKQAVTPMIDGMRTVRRGFLVLVLVRAVPVFPGN